jgi:5-methylcytosine-specific restriction enzyme A
VTLADLTQDSIRRALDQFHELGRDAFLERYGFGRARDYFVLDRGVRCDSKAIAGAAHGFLEGMTPLGPHDFSGGKDAAAKRLKDLGFNVTDRPDPHVINFEPGKVYSRRRDIHDVYGGQEQGGISTPFLSPFIFLFTGESGGQFGYNDGPQDDGTFSYTGEGQHGDMQFLRGNRAIRDHVENGEDLLLFESTKPSGMYRFIGCYACAGWTSRVAPDRDGTNRNAIVFQLVPVSAEIQDPESDADVSDGASLDDLRRAAYAAVAIPSTPPKDARRSFFQRSAAVKAYVLRRANGCCEACGGKAPFARKDGTPYLEPHHTRRVADGGPDHPAWVAAICPTCHREIHHGQNGEKRNESLQQRLREIEPVEPDPV